MKKKHINTKFIMDKNGINKLTVAVPGRRQYREEGAGKVDVLLAVAAVASICCYATAEVRAIMSN